VTEAAIATEEVTEDQQQQEEELKAAAANNNGGLLDDGCCKEAADCKLLQPKPAAAGSQGFDSGSLLGKRNTEHIYSLMKAKLKIPLEI
jgi:hypothetical protein